MADTDTLDAFERVANDLYRHARAHPAYKDSSAIAKEGAKAIFSLITALRTADERASRMEGLLREAREFVALDRQGFLESTAVWKVDENNGKAFPDPSTLDGDEKSYLANMDDFLASIDAALKGEKDNG